MALRPGRQRLSATPIIAKGVVYTLQNPRASKSATHGFASKSDTRHRKKHLRRQVLFSKKFACGYKIWLRHVKQLRCGIFASQMWGGEFHLTLRRRSNISQCATAHYFTFGVSRTFRLKIYVSKLAENELFPKSVLNSVLNIDKYVAVISSSQIPKDHTKQKCPGICMEQIPGHSPIEIIQ